MSGFYLIIPARSGSKRIPGKNLKVIGNFPMLAHPIRTALSTGIFNNIYVSTDSEEVARVANKFGAETPFIRNSELSDDFTPTIPVINDAISNIGQIRPEDYVCCVYPTSIFLSSKVFIESKEILSSLTKGQFLVSITSFDYPIQRALVRNGENVLNFLEPANSQKRSQDLPETFHDAAQFYWATAETWATAENVFANARGIYINRNDIQDIDTPEDFQRAETIMKLRER